MATQELSTPQRIDRKYDENTLVALSRAQNDGMASLAPAFNETGDFVGYDSRYPIALDTDGTPTGYAQQAPFSLEGVKTDLKTRVDTEAERRRLQLITPGAGQAMEYQEAQAEAQRALAALAADDNATLAVEDYPMLAASIGYDTDPSTGKSTVDVAGEARSVDLARQQFLKVGSAIRKIRLDGKAAIDAATGPEGARAAYAAIQWPSFGG